MTKNPYKLAYIIGLAGYAMFILMSIIFYKERTIFIDIAFHLFHIARTGAFAIQNNRFGAVVTQIFPLLSFKAGLPLSQVMLVYSLGFAIYYTLCYILCGFLFKQYEWGLVLLLFNVLFVTDTFYWIQSELPQGIAFMIVCFSFISSSLFKKNVLSYLLLFAAIPTIAFFHPLIIFPFIYILIFLYLRNDFADKRLLLGIGLFFIAVIAFKNTVMASAYDQSAMEGVKHFSSLFPHYLKLYANKRFLINCTNHFYWIPIIIILNTAAYIYKRQWGQMIFFICYTLGYLLFVNVCFPDANTDAFYIENLYLPMGILIALPFVFITWPLLQKKRLGTIVIAFIIVTGICRIYIASSRYTTRLDWERNFLTVNLNRKLIICESRVPKDTLIMTWGTPYEFWLLSTTEYHKTASIIVIPDGDINKYTRTLNDHTYFLTMWGCDHYIELPKKYFIFNDSTTTYSILK